MPEDGTGVGACWRSVWRLGEGGEAAPSRRGSIPTAPAERVSGRMFNLGCGDRISVNRLWAEIREAVGFEPFVDVWKLM